MIEKEIVISVLSGYSNEKCPALDLLKCDCLTCEYHPMKKMVP